MAKAPVLGLCGSETLLGRELRDVAATSGWKVDWKLLAAADQKEAKFTEWAGEAALLVAATPATLLDASVVMLAGTRDEALRIAGLGAEAPLIDLTYGCENLPNARLRAPLLESKVPNVPSGTIHVVAHPAAIGAALLLGRIREQFPIAASVLHVFEPASERGLAGIEELQKQVANLLTFKSLPKAVYDTQAAFTMLAAFGEEAPEALEEIEGRIERHLATLLESQGPLPPPSLRLLQAPVFHAHALSLWCELEEACDVRALEQALRGGAVEITQPGFEPPNSVSIAGQDGITISAPVRDRNHPKAFWIWGVCDNLRLSASNALSVARQLS